MENELSYADDENSESDVAARQDGGGSHDQEEGSADHSPADHSPADHSPAENQTHDAHANDAAHGRDAGSWGIDDALQYHLDSDHLIGHVQDADYFEWFGYDEHGSKNKIQIPHISPFTNDRPFIGNNGVIEIDTSNNQFVGPADFQPSKFIILELVGALIVCAIFIPYARRIKNGDRPKGRFWNMIDAMVCFVRDDIAVPSIGSADAKRFLPFVWTIFFFVLVLNLIGMVPGMGAATGSISVTAAFALAVFFVVLATGMKKMGVVGFLKAQAPHLDIHPAMKLILIPMIWAIEMFGLMIKHVVLAVRLFANMFAGHLVLGVFVAFIAVTWGFALGWGVAPMVVLSSIALSLLELLVAFIQAYVFAFLTALFIGTAIHPH